MDYRAKLDRLLDRMGGLYLASDLIEAVHVGEMQCLAENDSVAITRIAQYPRAKALEIIGAVGALEDLRRLHDKVLDFADEVNAGVVLAFGRKGWIPDAEARGWRIKAKSYLYAKDM